MAGRHRKPPQPRGSGRHRRPPNRSSIAAPAIAAVVVLGAGGVAAAAAFSGGSSPPPAPPAVAQPLSAAPAVDGSGLSSTPQASASASTPPAESPAPPAGGAASTRHRPASVALALSVRRSISWVQVTAADGRVLFRGILRPGHRLVYRRGPLGVVIGNAGVVRMQRGRHITDPAGRAGQVLRFTVAG